MKHFVTYHLSVNDYNKLQKKALDSSVSPPSVIPGTPVPMIVTKRWSDGAVNGVAFLDREDLTLFVTNAGPGKSEGQFIEAE